MRLFAAIRFGEVTRRALTSLQTELRKSAVRGRFTAPENLHLTLVFLGECNEVQTEAAKGVVGETIAGPFPLEIDGPGRFSRDGGDVRWARVRECAPLLDLQRDLTERFRSAGFVLERRRYTPHITLARQVVTRVEAKAVPPFGEVVTEIHLMKSERIDGRLVYTSIYERELKHGTA